MFLQIDLREPAVARRELQALLAETRREQLANLGRNCE
jgi:hypothetical protein